MKIWAHRGCSQLYPENTLLAFEKAMNVKNLTGVELDIQLTRDGEIVVIHDEKVDRTTDGFGYVRDYTLKELKQLHIFAGRGVDTERVPTMKEVIELLLPRMKNDGFMINIELKTSVFNYPGIEEKIVALVDEMGIKDNIVYSSFWAESLVNVHAIDPAAKLGVLDNYVSNCLYKAIGLESMWRDVPNGSIALHPAGIYMDIPAEKFKGRDVRAWFGGHLYPELPTGGKLDVNKYAEKGATDLILNEPDKYLR
ncbi:glycerophosphoryl diester phosphodiesterase [Butyrivibrio sp. INlla18]|uniref:glycerophosphodiester phosphodiesterase family protein n=1 Tax=Butyrivibrio sp. INlla18 TaxID=1520806 RepID=UPI000886ABC4|nr:glycerophosphodiester phosphodiesterase family protein [Butyrivibrio sp. INlla18]SDA41760.1 glycerophosphoryl diester phosphodiesterase [Butyrivibrio sp. INlla18]